MSVVREDPATIQPSHAEGQLTAKGEHLNRTVGRTPGFTPRLSLLMRRVSTEALPYLSHQIQYVGRAGIVGIGLIVFSIVGFLSANSILRAQLLHLRSEYAVAQQSQSDGGGSSREAAAGVRAKALISELPSRSDLPMITQRIVEQADAAGLALERGSYDVDIVRSGQIARARLTFPVHGSYPKVRRFIDGTLGAISSATLDGLRLERKEIGAAEIDADIHFAVFLRVAP